MGTQVSWVEHKSKKIMVTNVSGLEEASYLDALEDMKQGLLSQPPGSTILQLINMTDSRVTPATQEKGKEIAGLTNESGITTITAIVGINGVQKIVAKAISKDIHYADSVEKAKDWLVAQ